MNEYIFIGQLLRDRHSKSIKTVDKGDMVEDPWHVPGAKSWPVQSVDLGVQGGSRNEAVAASET